MREDQLLPAISLTAARQTIRERLPQLKIERIAYLGGGSYSVFAVNDDLVFRFPKRDDDLPAQRFVETEEAFGRETTLLDRLRARVAPHQVPVPVYHLPQPSPHFPGPIYTYQRFDGTPLDPLCSQIRADGRLRASLAGLLGDFLTKLHSTPHVELAALDLELPDIQSIRQGWLVEYERVRTRILPWLGPAERHWLAAVYERFLSDVDGTEPDLVFIHGDLGPENVLLAPSRINLQVIDFEDSGVDVAAKDFCLWWGEFGDEFLEAMLDQYRRTLPRHFLALVRFYYERIPVIYFDHAERTGNEIFRTFGRTLLDHRMNERESAELEEIGD